MKCPKCGNEDCQITAETTSSGKDFSVGKGCCGALLLGPIGILCEAQWNYSKMDLYKKCLYTKIPGKHRGLKSHHIMLYLYFFLHFSFLF